MPTIINDQIGRIILDPFSKAAATEIAKYLCGYLGQKIKKSYKFNKVSADTYEELAEKFSSYLEKSYIEYSTIPTIALKEKKTYLHSIYYPLSIKSIESIKSINNVQKFLKYDEEFFSQHPKVVILDNAGMGKSTFLKFLFLSAMQQKIQIPIFIELRHLKENHSIIDEICNKINYLSEDFDKEQILELIKDGDFLFFLDGYDEISLADREEVSKKIKQFLVYGNKNRFIITSRPDAGLNLSEFDKYEIEKLKQDEAFMIIEKYDNVTGYLLKEELITTISKSTNQFEQFLQNPMFVSLLYLTYKNKRELPLTQSSFYRTVYDALYSDHDFTKDDGFKRDKMSDLSRDELEYFFQKFAYFCFRKDINDFELDFLLNTIRIILEDNYFQNKNQVYPVFLDITKNVPLLIKEGVNYRWIHKSFMEYFAAKHISIHPNKIRIIESLTKKGLEYYQNIMKIYIDIDRNTFDQLLVEPLLEEFIEYVEGEIHKGTTHNIKEVTFNNNLVFANCTKELVDTTLKELGYQKEDVEKEIHNLQNKIINGSESKIARVVKTHLYTTINQKISESINVQITGWYYISPVNLTPGVSQLEMLTHGMYLVGKSGNGYQSEKFKTLIKILEDKNYPVFSVIAKEKKKIFYGGTGDSINFPIFYELDFNEGKMLCLDDKCFSKEIIDYIDELYETSLIFADSVMDYDAAKNYLKQIKKQNEDFLDDWED
ncbi:TPA: NACHT domain-containing protein [Bacillus cereus]|nr:NACHT domain-containing protein [Bacillus cereus]HDR8176923.1 NACHT domain-containing protein [Bacillus cereus]